MPDNKLPATEIDQLLPWLETNSLEEDEKNKVNHVLQKSPSLKKEYVYMSALRQSINNSEQEIQVPVELAWQRLKKEIKKEREIQSLTEQQSFSQQNNRSPWWKGFSIAASILIVAQMGFIISTQESNSLTNVDYQPLSVNSAQTIKIQFKDNVSSRQITQLLQKNNLKIIDGPSVKGFYQVVGKGRLEPVLEILKLNTEIVNYVQMD